MKIQQTVLRRSSIAVIIPLLVGLSLTLGGLLPPLSSTYANPAVLYATSSAPGNGDCTSWTDTCTLQTALSRAASGDEIWVAAGVHYPGSSRADTFSLQDGVALYGGFAGTETARDQRDWQTHITVLSGDIDQNDLTDAHGVVTNTGHIRGANAYHVVYTSMVTETAVLDGFTITAGHANGSSGLESHGAGMLNYVGHPTLRNLTFSGNEAAQEGGGMLNYASTATLENVTFAANVATLHGGGMVNTAQSRPTLTNTTFIRNDAGEGGGMFNDACHPILTGATFSGNRSTTNGGGMYNTDSTPTLTEVSFGANIAGEGGGGMFNYASSPQLTRVTFISNNAGTDGGALLNRDRSAPLVTHSRFISNTAVIRGGAMFNDKSGATPALINVTFERNQASLGGALSINFTAGATLVNTTFSQNAANYGGALYNNVAGQVVLTNTLLWGNTAVFTGAQIYNDQSTPEIAYSDIQGCRGSGAFWNTSLGNDGGGNIDSDPLFFDATRGNLRLRSVSPAIDAGDNTALPAYISTDLDGSARFVDSPAADTGNGAAPIVDMGAYEAQLNREPSFTSTPTTAAAENVPYTAMVTATDPDLVYGDALTLTATTLPAWLTFTDHGDSTATLSGTPTESAVGDHAVVLLVEDRAGVTALQTFNLYVSYANDAPTFTTTPVTTALEDALYTATVVCVDPDLLYGDVLTLTADMLPPWLALQQTGATTVTLSGTPTETEVGAHTIVLNVTDTGGLTGTQAFTLTVVNVNDTPLFISTPLTTATQGALYTPTIITADPDQLHGNAPLTLTAPTLPTWLMLTDHGNNTATLSGTPTNVQVGNHPVVLRVTDSGGLFAEQAFTLTVANVNDAPTFTSAPVTTATQDTLYIAPVGVDDPDLAYGDAVTLTAPTLPAWLTFTDHGDGTATLSGTPTNADVGDHAVVLRVTDRAGVVSDQEFVITVEEKPDYRIYLPLVSGNWQP